MKKLPIGIQTFQQLIKGNYIYIDKTESIHKLLEGKYYFISRPRRFGKSLLISTLKELFSGNRELFKGLWIENHMKWKKHPVVHLDFSSISYESPQQLKNELAIKMENIAKIHNISLDQRRDYKGKFHDLLEALGKTVPAVVLIDEYDKPIIDLIHDKKRAKKNRDVLKGFFNMLKSTDEYLRFVLITGVSKFLRVSIFSGLNNLDDITIDDNYSTLMGYSHDELLHYFDDRLAILADKMNLERPLLLEHIKRWYNGYSWDGVQFMYNPFSILALFSKNRFGNYWFATGTPTFLIEHLKEKKKDIRQLEREEVAESILESYDIDNLEVISLLFQTG
ncbi:MAG: AAA family ATPase, partial [bacterium]|nr:AAA family ATPase [bacterium]